MTQSSQGYVPVHADTKVSWYHTGVFIGVSLLFCWPVGLFVLWTSPKTSLVTKAAGTLIFGGFGFLFLVGMAVSGSKKHDSAPPAVVAAAAGVPVVPTAPPPPLYKNTVALLSSNAFCILMESDKDLTERVASMQKTSKAKMTIEKACPSVGVLSYCVDKQPEKTVTMTSYEVSWSEALKKDCKGNWHETAALAEAVRNKPVAVTSAQLFDAYQDNEVQADLQYKGRRLLVSGKVDKVSKDVLDKPFVSLTTSNMFMSVLAYDMPESAVASLRKGMSLSLLCTGNGMTIGSPMLHDCTIR
jgi:hypothetical protein